MTSPRKPHSIPWPQAILFLVALAAYWPSFRGAFLFDDQPWIVDNWKMKSLDTLGSTLVWNTRPVITLTLALNYWLGGTNVVGYHVLNFAAHVTAGLLLFGILRRTFRLPRIAPRWGEHADFLAFSVALLWLVHPLQTQAVTYIIQRCESLMGMFYLLALYSLVRTADSPHPRRWLGVCLAAVWIGMGCKEVMATAPVVLLLYDRIFLCSSWKEVLGKRWKAYLAMAPAVILLTVTIVGATRGVPQLGDPLDSPTPAQYLRSEPGILLHYLRLSVLPDDLCFDYRWPVVPTWSAALPSGLSMLALFLASVVALFRWPAVGFVAFSFFVILAPTSSFNPIVDLAVEHRMYLPLATLLLLAALAIAEIGRLIVRNPRSRAVGAVCLLLIITVAWSARTFVRNRIYQYPLAVWKNVLAHAPDNARAHHNLGAYLNDCGETEQAVAEYRRSLEISGRDGVTYFNLAQILFQTGKADEAIALLRSAKAAPPSTAWVEVCLGEILEQQGNNEEAIAHFREAIAIFAERNTTFGRAHYKLGKALAKVGRVDEAIAHYLIALERRPIDIGCNFRLAHAYQRQGAFDEAICYYENALKLSPKLDKARRNIELCQAGVRDGEPPSEEKVQ